MMLLLTFNLLLGVRSIGFTVLGTIVGTLFRKVFLPPAKCKKQTLWDAVGVKCLLLISANHLFLTLSPSE